MKEKLCPLYYIDLILAPGPVCSVWVISLITPSSLSPVILTTSTEITFQVLELDLEEVA